MEKCNGCRYRELMHEGYNRVGRSVWFVYCKDKGRYVSNCCGDSFSRCRDCASYIESGGRYYCSSYGLYFDIKDIECNMMWVDDIFKDLEI